MVGNNGTKVHNIEQLYTKLLKVALVMPIGINLQ